MPQLRDPPSLSIKNRIRFCNPLGIFGDTACGQAIRATFIREVSLVLAVLPRVRDVELGNGPPETQAYRCASMVERHLTISTAWETRYRYNFQDEAMLLKPTLHCVRDRKLAMILLCRSTF